MGAHEGDRDGGWGLDKGTDGEVEEGREGERGKEFGGYGVDGV